MDINYGFVHFQCSMCSRVTVPAACILTTSFLSLSPSPSTIVYTQIRSVVRFWEKPSSARSILAARTTPIPLPPSHDSASSSLPLPGRTQMNFGEPIHQSPIQTTTTTTVTIHNGEITNALCHKLYTTFYKEASPERTPRNCISQQPKRT